MIIFYKSWQHALTDFLEKRGQNYNCPFTMLTEFANMLERNNKGSYFIYWPREQ